MLAAPGAEDIWLVLKVAPTENEVGGRLEIGRRGFPSSVPSEHF